MTVEQILTGRDNFSYLIYSESEKEAALVDPGFNAAGPLKRLSELDLDLAYLINTHHHADHTAANSSVKKLFSCQVLAHELDAPMIKGGVDTPIIDGHIIQLGNIEIKFIHTPGHTKGGVCLLVKDEPDAQSSVGTYLLTGDTLFIGDCGRTDLPDGGNQEMFDSLGMLKELPDDAMIYPGHDYGNKPFDTLGNQKKVNKVLLARTLLEFSQIP